jgi:hypothetical protein
LISWKYSLEKINGELDLARKKKQALDKLHEEGRVSQPTYDSFSSEVAEAIIDIEEKQKALVGKMNSKIAELEQQMKTLEYLLVNAEIRRVSEETEEETYRREHDVLSLGLDTTRRELDEIKEAVTHIGEQDFAIQPPLVTNEGNQSEIESETEKRLEIIMDTETATQIETTIEQPDIEQQTETADATIEQPDIEQQTETADATIEQPDIEQQSQTIESAAEDEDAFESTVEEFVEPIESRTEDLQVSGPESSEDSAETAEEIVTEDSEELSLEETEEEPID